MFGGERLDAEVEGGYELVAGAQELVDNLPAAGHVITNLSYFAHSHWFPLRGNTNVDVAAEIHESMVPSLKNEKILLDVLDILKKADKKIILYISSNYMDRADDEVKAAWKAYYEKEFSGSEYLAYENLIQGYIERVKDYADGYWIDTVENLHRDGRVEDFDRMIRKTDPGAMITFNNSKKYHTEDGKHVLVDSDGFDDIDDADYKIIIHEPTNTQEDYTNGHVTPLAQGAPPNSWAYEEFTLPNMIEEPVVFFEGKRVVKHGWFPVRTRWHSPRVDLLFGAEQAYRFAKSITEAGASITFANTIDYGVWKPGFIMHDEMLIMKEVSDRMQMTIRPDFERYSRPPGARLVGE